jgi:hypothetical protein
MDTEVSDPAMELRNFVAKLMQSSDLESVASEIDGKIISFTHNHGSSSLQFFSPYTETMPFTYTIHLPEALEVVSPIAHLVL